MEAVRIQLDHLVKTFVHRVKGRVTAVDDVNLEVEPGELLTLLGPSGCGKTTTLRIVAGFEKPDSGRVLIGGQDVTGQLANRRNIGFVFQNYALFPHLSIFENVAYGLKVQRAGQREIERAVTEVLELVGLRGYEQQFPHQISGGEQQRVALARAIVIRPKVLLFDEPLSNLDAKLRVHTRGEIRRLQRSLKITSIYVTHDQEEAMAISDRIVVMNRGAVAQSGTAEELYFSPRDGFVARFIGKVNTLRAGVRGTENGNLLIEVLGRICRVARPGGGGQPDGAPAAGALAGVPPADGTPAAGALTHNAPAAGAPADGQVVEVFVRPEFINLTVNPGPGQIQGVITERAFLGEKIDYTVDVGGTSLSATSRDPLHQCVLEIGQRVGVDFEESSILLPGKEER